MTATEIFSTVSGSDAGDGLQLFRRHVGQRLDAGDAGFAQLLQHRVAEFGGNVLQRGSRVADQRVHLLLDLLTLLLFALDVDLPAQQLGGQAHILPLLADGKRELGVIDDDFQMLVVAVHDGDARDLGGLQSFFRKASPHPRDTR